MPPEKKFLISVSNARGVRIGDDLCFGSTMIFLLNKDILEHVVSFLDVKSFGRLASTCVEFSNRPWSTFWRQRALHIYGVDDYNTRTLSPKDLLRRVVWLRNFARLQQKESDVHDCYAAVNSSESTHWVNNINRCKEMNGHCPLEHPHVEPIYHPEDYDFFIRLRYNHGRQLFERFIPGNAGCRPPGASLPNETVLWLGIEGLVESWDDLRAIQHIYDTEPAPYPDEPNANMAWAYTGLCLVAMRKQSTTPILVGVHFSFDIIERQTILSMDFDGYYFSGVQGGRVWHFDRSVSVANGELVGVFVVNGYRIQALGWVHVLID